MQASGRIISCNPDQLTYAVGDTVRLNVSAEITYIPNADWSGWWYLFIDVKNSAGQRIGKVFSSQTIAPWTKEDYAKWEGKISCGKFDTSDMLTVNLLWASSKDIPLVYTGIVKHLATRKVYISVAEPAYVPPPEDGEDVSSGLYQCQVCGAIFTSQSALAAHVKTHEEILPPVYTCQYCGRAFSTQKLLDAHIASAHREEEEEITPTPPGEEEEKKFDWTWVIIGGVAILALTTLSKPKGGKR